MIETTPAIYDFAYIAKRLKDNQDQESVKNEEETTPVIDVVEKAEVDLDVDYLDYVLWYCIRDY